jgi:hypothetical protein
MLIDAVPGKSRRDAGSRSPLSIMPAAAAVAG